MKNLTPIDFELKLVAGPLSYTQVNTYLWDPAKYYKQYVFPGGGLDMEQLRKDDIGLWEKITLGGIFQDAVSVVGFNWRKKLKENGFTSDKERIMAAALSDPGLIRWAISKCEIKKAFNYRGIPVVIKMDGFDEAKKHILENKFGVPRQQEKVDEDLQLSYYAFGVYHAFGIQPEKLSITLQSVNDRNGKVNKIETSRTMDDVEHVGDLIVDVARNISAGVWEK